MGRVVVQAGHVPLTKGATGTWREQEFTRTLAPMVAERLRERGHTAYAIGANDPIPPCDYFVSLHTDSGNAQVARSGASSIRGASVGYPDGPGGKAAGEWKRQHQRAGYDGGFHADNYTIGLRRYYSFRQTSARYRFVAEHGTTTNAVDERLLFSRLDAWADAHVATVGAILGHPKGPTPGDDMIHPSAGFAIPGGGIIAVGADGGVFTFDGAPFYGSLPGLGVRPNAPIVGGAPFERAGYWLVGADGGLFALGSAPPLNPHAPLADEWRAGTRKVIAVIPHANARGFTLLTDPLDVPREGLYDWMV